MLKITDGSNNWKFVDVAESDLDEAIDYCRENPSNTSLLLNAAKCQGNELSRIANHKNGDAVKAIQFLNRWDNLDPLESCIFLEKVSFGFDDSNFNFSKLVNIASIGGVWSRYWKGLNNCTNLAEFRVSKYKGLISEIPNLAKIHKIELIQPAFTTLDGLELAEQLSFLGISLAKNLCDISSLKYRKCTLQELRFSKCKKISFLNNFEKLESLKSLAIVDCKELDSISFISELKKLEVLEITGTVIIDGDLSSCMKHPALRSLWSDRVLNYRPSIDEVKMSLDARARLN